MRKIMNPNNPRKLKIPPDLEPGGPDRSAQLHAEGDANERRTAQLLKTAEQSWPGCLPVTAYKPARTKRRLR